jgi:hypothetical protein
MKIFKGQNLIEFAERFKSDQDHREYLSNIKWSEGYVCKKCKHAKSQICKDYDRTCNICSDTESAMAYTLFHKVKFGLKKIFEKHIGVTAKVTTVKWKGYNPIAKDYDLKQILSDKGSRFKALYIMIHQVKSWIRTAYSLVSEKNINRYFDEFCYRINRSQSKDTIFNNLIKRMVKAYNITHEKIICA